MPTQRDLTRQARRVARALEKTNKRIVLAESCTGGLVSAALTRVPGISEFHCGSAVVYRLATKNRWLGIPNEILQRPGPVSREVASLMAERALERTPEADLSASVTGHLGPEAPPRQDGLVFVAVALRPGRRRSGKPQIVVKRERLERAGGRSSGPEGRRLRNRRQIEAACPVLRMVQEILDN